MELLLKIILKIRLLLEKRTFKNFAPAEWENLPDLDKWDEVKNLNPSQFDWKINSYKYKSDKFSGLLDNTHPLDKPQYFFKDLPYARDCDDWARIWVQYYLYWGCDVQEWVVTNRKHPFTKSHFVAVVKDVQGWRLLNYKRYPLQHPTPEDALRDLQGWNGGDYDDGVRLQAMYREYKA